MLLKISLVLLSASAYSVSQGINNSESTVVSDRNLRSITLACDSCKLGDWMNEFSQKSNLNFVFESGLLDKEVSIQTLSGSFPIEKQLNYTFKQLNVQFRIEGSHVLLTAIAPSADGNQPAEVSNDTTINRLLEEIYVHGRYSDNQLQAQCPGQFIFDASMLNAFPSPGSEKDIIKTLQLIPGVQNTREGVSELQVRGGGAGENLFLYENVTLYNPGHLFGFFSSFDSEIIRNMDFYKASFPAKYGGKLSSVTDMTLKDGGVKDPKRQFSIGLLSSKFIWEQPLNHGKTSFMLYGRTTYMDLIGVPLYRLFTRSNGEESFYNYHFYDLNGKITHRFSDKHQVSLFCYHGMDFFRYKETTKMVEADAGSVEVSKDTKSNTNRWGNTVAGASYRFISGPKLNFTSTLAYNQTYSYTSDKVGYSYIKGEHTKQHYGEMTMRGSVSDWIWKGSVAWMPGLNHRVSVGIDLIHHLFSPAIHSGKMTNKDKTQTLWSAKNYRTLEGGLYLEDVWKIIPRLEMRLGGRFSWLNSGEQRFLNFEPRLSMNWQVFKDFSLQASYTEMSQYAHLLQKKSILFPSNQWIPAMQGINPTDSRQYAGGLFYHFRKNWIFSLEGYYKRAYHVTEYKDNSIFSNSDWQDKLTQGDGEAYGVEVQLRKSSGKTQGWIGYTYSRSDRWFTNQEVNRGKKYQSDYHAPHSINVVVTHRFSDRFDISAAWTYRSGIRTTVAFEYYDFNVYVPGSFDGYMDFVASMNPIDYANTRNNFRLPANHRLDLGANFHKKHKRGVSTWSIDVYNAYCRMNTLGAMAYYTIKDGKRQAYVSYSWLLPIVPSFTYTFTF